MPRPVRFLLLALALGLLTAAATARPAGAGPAQEFGTTTSTTITAGATGAEVAPSTLVGETTTTESNQTVVDNQPSEGKPLWSESRKVAAVIGALVFVALALTLLTIRYVRMTKPVLLEQPPVADPTPATPPAEAAPVQHAATDHDAVDAAWKPRGTGEHPAVPVVARPGTGARRAALGGPPQP